MASAGGSLTTADLAAERRALVTTLREVGPDAPTLAEGWTARDLAAHVAATEQVRGVPTFLGRTLVARYGWRLNDSFRSGMAVDLRRFRRHGFEWSLARLERPSPALLGHPRLLPVSMFEIYVHHEDVRHPNAVARRTPLPDLTPCIEWLLRYHRRVMGHVGIRVLLPGGRELRAGGAGPTLMIEGAPDEVVLWLAGRRQAATVAVTAPDGATAAVEARFRV